MIRLLIVFFLIYSAATAAVPIRKGEKQSSFAFAYVQAYGESSYWQHTGIWLKVGDKVSIRTMIGNIVFNDGQQTMVGEIRGGIWRPIEGELHIDDGWNHVELSNPFVANVDGELILCVHKITYAVEKPRGACWVKVKIER